MSKKGRTFENDNRNSIQFIYRRDVFSLFAFVAPQNSEHTDAILRIIGRMMKRCRDSHHKSENTKTLAPSTTQEPKKNEVP
jgi:hypothetical protein